jgi:hypothetical protein
VIEEKYIMKSSLVCTLYQSKEDYMGITDEKCVQIFGWKETTQKTQT